MNNIVARKIVLTTSYQPLSSVRLIVTVTVTAHPDNAGPMYVLGDTGQDVPLSAGEWHIFQRVNLAELQVKGSAGDVVTVIGGTW